VITSLDKDFDEWLVFPKSAIELIDKIKTTKENKRKTLLFQIFLPKYNT